MANNYFQFKQFTVHQEHCAMKVTTDACLFGAWVASWMEKFGDPQDRILDIGTGTGLLSLMIAQKFNGTIDAIEIDEAAASQAKENIMAAGWSSRIKVIKGDVREMLNQGSYQFIVSNPPFYENEWRSPDVKRKQAHHDESLLLSQWTLITRQVLAEKGMFFVLLPYKRLQESLDIFASHDLQVTHLCRIRQTTGHGYFRVLIAGTTGSANAPLPAYQEDEMAIKDESGQYTTRFTELLSDYYLYL